MADQLHTREPLRVPLANQPTRGHWLRYDAGVKVWLKRDDQTGTALTGNKVRKLEYLMAEALAGNATHVITCGGEQSNHARATAFAATQLGMKSVLLLRTDDPEKPPAPTGNILLDRLVGAEIVWISRTAWRDRERLMAEQAALVTAAGGSPYIIPEGGSNALGSWGYIRGMRELATQLADIASPEKPITIVYACGSGGTGAGLVMAAKLFGLADLGIRVAGINVCDDRPYFTEADIDIIDGHVGAGYAKSRPEELATIRDVCRSDGIIFDPVYTGKAFHGVVTELRKDPKRFGSAVAFLHTGGIYGLFASAESIVAML